MVERTVVVGFGNLLMGDDGVGIHVVRSLAERGLPRGAEAVDGGVASLEILGSLLDAGRIIIVDALAGGGEPGSVYRLTPADLGQAETSPGFSLHDFTLPQTLALLARTASLPPIVIYGVEPAGMDPGLELSPPVAVAAGRVADLIIADLEDCFDA
ncbi:hydrogenase maturation protease [Anaeroselena agilis]|uniref:Hydrogenase maturation protease n=1 Tax=Anaeroselena agilis TaxID=3063788 RepID=A0ABU3P3L9_9FIRM|nr:hydrogenase maturation protease [Selenomonadales bacterium 4137-cl]